jgi:RNA polymerase sigma-70 factor (ECF subfamily)
VVPEFSHQDRISDNQLMAAVAEGDCAAFEHLYDRHVRACFGLAVRIVQEPSLAEDIVQEVFTKLWSRPGTFSPARGSFNTWLLTVVRNQALDKLRRAKTGPGLHIVPLPLHVDGDSTNSDTIVDTLPDAGPTPHDQAWEKETTRIVRDALGQLSRHQYQAIELAYFGGLTQREIADKLQQPLGTVKTRTRTALRRLHLLLSAQSALLD